ncbi:hypothetical protein METP2_03226 [Methanosarcinales archaeon]|nr:hypothetical protein [Candidatus Methanoperedens sp.]CAG1000536.1 hypothetical protein METP2_03226 [Methanosarcinales archaeon]
MAPIEKIAKNDFSFDIYQYVAKLFPVNEKEPIDISDALKQLNNIHERKSEVVNKIRNYLEELKNTGD